MNINQSAKTLSENVWTVFVSRLAMVATPFVASALVWFGSNWLEKKFTDIIEPLQVLAGRVDNLEKISIDQKINGQRRDIFIQNNKETAAKISDNVDKLVDSVQKINENVAVIADRERRIVGSQP